MKIEPQAFLAIKRSHGRGHARRIGTSSPRGGQPSCMTPSPRRTGLRRRTRQRADAEGRGVESAPEAGRTCRFGSALRRASGDQRRQEDVVHERVGNPACAPAWIEPAGACGRARRLGLHPQGRPQGDRGAEAPGRDGAHAEARRLPRSQTSAPTTRSPKRSSRRSPTRTARPRAGKRRCSAAPAGSRRTI